MSDLSLCQDDARMGEGRRRFAVTVALVLLVGAACTDTGHGSAAISPTTAASAITSTTARATTTTLDPTVAAILASYRASWADLLAVAETYPVNPLDPRLAQHDTGIELSGVLKALSILNSKYHYNVGPTDLAPVVTSIVGNSAVIMDCVFDHSFEFDAVSRAPVEQPDVGHTLDKFEMTRIGGTWYVSSSTILASGKTRDACSPGDA